jgi:hypothetical protein
MLSGEATNTNFIVFGLTLPGLESIIYCTPGKHASHYTTDAFEEKFLQTYTDKVIININGAILKEDKWIQMYSVIFLSKRI